MLTKEKKLVALVTGHSGTIGSAIALRLKSEDYFVIGISKSSKVECVNLEFLIDLSLNNYNFLSELEDIIQTKGKLRIFVSAAGIPFVKRFEEITQQEYEKVINVNLSSAVFISQVCFKLMKDSEEDSVIIFISSQVALPGSAQAYNSIYSLTKCGFNGLVRSLSKEGEPNIRVNAVCAGDFHSKLSIEGGKGFCEITGMSENDYNKNVIERSSIKRWINPSEIVNAIFFLISNEAMTGVNLNVSGGTTTS